MLTEETMRGVLTTMKQRGLNTETVEGAVRTFRNAEIDRLTSEKKELQEWVGRLNKALATAEREIARLQSENRVLLVGDEDARDGARSDPFTPPSIELSPGSAEKRPCWLWRLLAWIKKLFS